ncbi:MAG: sel1 repeat family protein [Proteobacteria bacterium]|nr:sel1 repeat family protein [Pseudomonadota bacterium]
MQLPRAVREAYVRAERCLAAGRFAEASGLIAALLAHDPDPDLGRLRDLLETIVEEAAEPGAQVSLATLLLDPAGEEADPERALALLLEAADAIEGRDEPDPGLAGVAHGLIADCYLRGVGAGADPAAAFQHYRRAAELGNGRAAFAAGLACESGLLDQAVDRAEAKRYYRMAADAGDVRAMTALALLYLADGDAPDEVTIVDLLEEASAKGDSRAAETLSRLGDEVVLRPAGDESDSEPE